MESASRFGEIKCIADSGVRSGGTSFRECRWTLLLTGLASYLRH